MAAGEHRVDPDQCRTWKADYYVGSQRWPGLVPRSVSVVIMSMTNLGRKRRADSQIPQIESPHLRALVAGLGRSGEEYSPVPLSMTLDGRCRNRGDNDADRRHEVWKHHNRREDI